MEKQTQRGLVLAELTSVELGFDFAPTLKVLKTYVLFLIPFHRVFSFRDVAASLPALPSMTGLLAFTCLYMVSFDTE